jgi:hypothetical protein
MTAAGRSQRKHIGFVLRDYGKLHTFERGMDQIDPVLIKEGTLHVFLDLYFHV